VSKAALRRPLEPAQFTSIRYGERLAELGAVPSIGSVGDSFDNALAETVNGLYKSELIYGPEQGAWCSIEAVGLATLSWLAWYNTRARRMAGGTSHWSMWERRDAARSPSSARESARARGLAVRLCVSYGGG
jgi:putative transposase